MSRPHLLSWSLLVLAVCCLFQASIQKGNLKEATKSFETSLKVKPTFAAGHAGLAYALLLRDKTLEATRAAQAAVKLYPKLIDSSYILGAVQLKVGEYDNAIKSAETAIQIDLNFAPAYLLKNVYSTGIQFPFSLRQSEMYGCGLKLNGRRQ